MINYVLRKRIIVVAMAVTFLLFFIFLFNFINNSLNDNSKSSQTDTSKLELLSTSSDNSISMDIRKEIQADEYYTTFHISISPSSRSISIMNGYDKKIISSKNYANNKSAYEQFVYALDKADFLNTRSFNENENDTRGVCPSGSLTTFNVMKSQNSAKKIWTTSCKDVKGNMKSNYSKIYNLFISQLPEDSKDIISEI